MCRRMSLCRDRDTDKNTVKIEIEVEKGKWKETDRETRVTLIEIERDRQTARERDRELIGRRQSCRVMYTELLRDCLWCRCKPPLCVRASYSSREWFSAGHFDAVY